MRLQFVGEIEQISLGKGTLASVPLANIQLITDMASKRAKIFAEVLQNIFNTASKNILRSQGVKGGGQGLLHVLHVLRRKNL